MSIMGFALNPGTAVFPKMFKHIRYAAKEGSQQLAFLRGIFWPGRVWTCDGYMAGRPPRMVRIANAISLAVVQVLSANIHSFGSPIGLGRGGRNESNHTA
jgi:hypothetical protein